MPKTQHLGSRKARRLSVQYQPSEFKASLRTEMERGSEEMEKRREKEKEEKVKEKRNNQPKKGVKFKKKPAKQVSFKLLKS